MIATSEATREIGQTEPENYSLNSSADASTELFSPDSFWASRSVEPEDVPRGLSAKFLPYLEFTRLVVILGIVCVGGIGAVVGYYNYSKPDQSLEMTSKIDKLASNVTALEERVEAISDDQAHREVTLRGVIETSEIALQRSFGQLSDRLDDLRNEAQKRDAGMALRLDRLEAQELAVAPAPATPQPPASKTQSDSPSLRTSPSEPVAAVSLPTAPVDGVKKDAKHKKHKKLPRTPTSPEGPSEPAQP